MHNFTIIAVLAFRNTLRNPRRAVLTILAIAVGLGSAITLAALGRGVGHQMVRDALLELTGHIQIHAGGYVDDPSVNFRMPPATGVLRNLLDSPSITGWTERVRVPAVISSERESAGITLIGIDPVREKAISFLGTVPITGRKLTGVDDRGVLIRAKLLQQLDTEVGHRIVLLSQDISGKLAERGFRVVGVFDAELESTESGVVFVGREVLQEMLGIGNDVSELSLMLVQDDQLNETLSRLQHAAPSLEVLPWMKLQPLIGAMVKVQDGFLFFWLFIVVIAISFGLVNTVFMAIFERMREFGLIRALGMKPGLLVVQVLLEGIILLVIGCAIGNLAGFSAIALLHDGIDISQFARGAQFSGLRSVIYPRARPGDILVSNLMIQCIGILATLYPAWRVTKGKAIEALRNI